VSDATARITFILVNDIYLMADEALLDGIAAADSPGSRLWLRLSAPRQTQPAAMRCSRTAAKAAGAKGSWCATYPSQGINDNCSYSLFNECWQNAPQHDGQRSGYRHATLP
jgi:hypothetical protein